MQTDLLDEIHRFWFGPLTGPVDMPEDRIGLWFGNSPEVDAEIRARYGAAFEQAAAASWDLDTLTPRQRVGLIVLLDQVPRNIHRGTPAVYTHDVTACSLARQALDLPRDGLTPIELMFATLPLGHSEALADQQRAVAVLVDEILPMAPPHRFWEGALRQATLYRDIIARFGRFPHRNALLGRESTAEETAFMAETTMRPG